MLASLSSAQQADCLLYVDVNLHPGKSYMIPSLFPRTLAPFHVHQQAQSIFERYITLDVSQSHAESFPFGA